MKSSKKIYLVEVTFPNKEVTVKISKRLLNEKLVACANYFPIESMFWWEGTISKEKEWMAIYKTAYSNLKKVERVIEEMHPYRVPVISCFKIERGNDKFIEWLFRVIE